MRDGASGQLSRSSEVDVATLIAFLCGPHGRDINGATLPIDGAWSAGRG